MKTALITQVKVIQSLFIVFFVFAVLAVPAQVHATMLEYMVRENTTDTTAVSTSEAIFGWNSETHASGTAITYSGSKFELETGKYLVLYTQLWETTDATDNTRKEIQGRLDIGGVTATSGASQCYMRKLNGQQECMTSGNAIINVASATTSLETNFYKTDNDSTGIPTRENAGWNGVQVIKLPDAWNYARYALSGAVSANSASTTHADVAWDTTNEEDTGFSRSGANITIANAGRYLVSYSLPMFADGAGTTADRTEYTSRITLDDVEVEGTRVSTMMRTAQEAEDGVLNYIGIIDVGAGEVLAIENLQRAGLTATFQGGSLEIVQLPSAAETFIREATSGDQNTTTLTEFSWDTTAHEDASTFTINSATDSFTEVDVAGDYIFFWSQQSEAAAVSRGNPTARLSVNDTIIDYAGSDEFNRNDTWSYNAGHAHGAFVPGMSATDNVSVENIALATTGTMDVDHGAFSGLRLDSLYEENATTTVSGTLYSDEGSTVIGTGATIKLVVGAGSPVATTTTANGSGVYSFAVDQYLLGMDVPLTVFVDASSSIRAAVVTKATSTSSHISGLDLYQDRVIVRQEGSTSTSVTEFANYDSTDDSDLQFTASVATDEIKILEAQELHIWSGDTFLSPAYLNLTGDFHNNSGVFTHNGGTTTAGLMHAAYVDYKTVTTQESSPREVAFSTDGTKMYVVGSTNDQVVQYTLSPAWDASTASYVHATSVQAYENTPTGLFFKPDGTKMYINGTQNDSVHEYNLSSAWDVSTASYVHATSVAAQESDGHSVQFSTDGSKMFVIGDWGDDVNEYTLSTPWDVSTASFIDSKLVETQDEFPHGLVFARDGYKMFVSGYENDSVYEYTLSTAWDVSTAVLADTFSVGTVVTEPRDINFSADLDKMYIVSTQVGGRVYEYDFSTSSAFTGTLTGASSLGKLVTAGVQTIEFPANASTSEVDVTEGTVLSVSNSLTVTGDLTQNGTFDADGGTLYAAGIGFDLTTASYTNSSSTDEDSAQRGLAFSTDGTNMYITGVTTDKVYEYALSTAWDVSTAAYTHATSVQSQDGTPMGVAFSSDGSTMFVAGNDNNSVYEYTLSTAWDVSTAAYTHATSVSSQDTGPQGVSFSSGGTKMYVVGGTNNTIYSYTLSTPWDVSTAGYDNASLYMGNFDTNPNAAVVSTSGRYLYVAGFDSEQVFVYYLSTLYDISSATYLQTFTPTVSLNAFRDIAFSTSGDEFYTLDFNGVDQYSLRDVQTISGTLIATSSLGDVVISGEQSTYFADNASTTDFTISSGAATVTAPVVLTVAGNFTNSGGDFDHNYGVVELTGTSKTLSGTLTGGSALGSVEVFGSYTASNNASTSHLTIASGGSFVAPSLLTITGEYTNNGTFTNNSGTVYLNGYGNQRFSSYRSIGLSSQTEDTTLKGLTFSPDGLKMFTTGSTNDKVYEYTLGTAWVVATKTYVDGLSVATQTDDPIDVQFSDDGRTMYVLGGSSNSKPEAVNEYSLSTAYDVSTASYTDNFTVTTQDATPTGFRLSRNGTKLFILGDDGDDVNEYLLGTAWDVSTATYVDNYSVATEVTSTDGLFFSVNGDYMYVRGDVGEIHQYTLQVPFDVSTANYQEQVLYSSAFAGYGAWLTYDSSILFTNYSAFDRILTIELNAVHQGTMTGSSVFGSVVFDQTKQTFDVANASTSDLTITASAIVIAPTSTLSVAGDYINEGDFTVSADSVTDIAGAYTNSGTYTAAASSSLRVGGDFSNSGTYTGAGGSNLRVAGNYNNTGTKGIDVTSVFTGSGKTISGTLTSSSRFDEVVITGSYSLLDNATTSDLTITSGGALTATDALTITGSYSNAGTFSHNAGVVIVENNGFDISIASYLHATSVAAQDISPYDVAFNTTGTKMYVVGSSNDKVYEYDLSSAFDISTAS
ncbi:MAG: hypothetical protein KC877_05215, partial [Candidatus Kaiserbacteria bacterium]|nr:hypothetical protein [Candidatus Kaiserbacteria bacterium]